MNRIVELILTDLSNEKLKAETELERIINRDMDIDEKLKQTKILLSKLTLAEMSISKFTSLLNANNNNQNKEQDGKI